MSDRYQCVVLKGQASSWADVKAPNPDEIRIVSNNLTYEYEHFVSASIYQSEFAILLQPYRLAIFLWPPALLSEDVAIVSFFKPTHHLMALVGTPS